MPESINSSLKTPEDLIVFFQREFPDSIPLIGQEKLISDFFANPKSSLMSIKVSALKPSHSSAHHTTTKIKP
jgi:kynurenine 3-monooxygenase